MPTSTPSSERASSRTISTCCRPTAPRAPSPTSSRTTTSRWTTSSNSASHRTSHRSELQHKWYLKANHRAKRCFPPKHKLNLHFQLPKDTQDNLIFSFFRACCTSTKVRCNTTVASSRPTCWWTGDGRASCPTLD